MPKLCIAPLFSALFIKFCAAMAAMSFGYLFLLALVTSQASDECDFDGKEDCSLHVLQKAARLRSIGPFEGQGPSDSL